MIVTITPAQAAAESGFSVDHIRKLCRDGEIKAIGKLNGRYDIPRPNFDRWMKERAEKRTHQKQAA